MKTKLINSAQLCWHLLTDVPGWPDAPQWMRWRRASPLLIPCVVILLLALWHVAIRDPRIRAERATQQPLLSVEEEIAGLRMACSEQQAVELAARSAVATQLLLASPKELGPILHELKKEATDRHWEASFQASDTSAETPAADAQVDYLPVRAKLSAASAQAGACAELIALLERYSSTGKRIDLTRLTIRADEQGRYAVELNLRLACQRTHEKTSQ